MDRLSKKGAVRVSQSNAATVASKKEIDERRLRKLKVYLRSVSYNSCDGLPKFPTLPDLYEDTILSEELPCDTMKLSCRQHCAPTPFLIACCFNRRYPLNARKRAGNVRNRPTVKQGSEETIRSAQKKILRTPADFVSAVQTNQGKVSKTGVTGNLCADSTMQQEIEKKSKVTKIVGQDMCSGNKQNSDQECRPKDCETANHNNDVSQVAEHFGGKAEKVQSCCAMNKVIEEDDKLSNERKIREADQTSVVKISADRQEHVCERKDDVLAKDETERNCEVCDDLESCLKKEESRVKTKLRNKDVCSRMIRSNDQSYRHTSVPKTNPDNSNFEFEEKDKTGTASQKETVTLRKLNKPKVAQAYVYPEVEHAENFADQQKDEIISTISADLSRRTSTRLANVCNKLRTRPQDRERNMQRRAVKCTEKIKLKIAENANTRLRNRAVIKQPGYENHHTKGK